MTKQGITALPWRIKQGGHLPKNIIKILADDPLFGVATVLWKIPEDAAQCEANAAYIVLAVNAHEKLKESLIKAIHHSRNWAKQLRAMHVEKGPYYLSMAESVEAQIAEAEQLLRDLEAK